MYFVWTICTELLGLHSSQYLRYCIKSSLQVSFILVADWGQFGINDFSPGIYCSQLFCFLSRNHKPSNILRENFLMSGKLSFAFESESKMTYYLYY